MGTLSLACVFAVCAVLVTAAVTKLRSPVATRAATKDLGAAPWLAPLVAPTELVTAALLLVRPPLGALCAIAVLMTFSVMLVRVLRSGRTVRCGCFGAATSAPVNAATLLRNGALVLVSVLAGFAAPVGQVSFDNLLASVCVAIGIVSTGLVLLALADARRITGAVFPSARIEA